MRTENTAVSQNKLFYAVASLLFLVAAFLYLIRFFITPELIYPIRIDSLYVKYEAERNAVFSSDDQPEKSIQVYFNPLMLGMPYDLFDVKTFDGLLLKGWFIPSQEENANTLLIVHDLSESKLNYLNLIKQMHDRGLNVCAVDMRAHGNSEGGEFSPGMVALADMKSILDSLLKRDDANRIAIFGVGIGAASAIQIADYDGRCDALILQSPFDNFSDYVDNYAARKWKGMEFLFRAVLRRELEKRIRSDLSFFDLSEVIRCVNIPTLVIAGSNDEIVSPRFSKTVYDSCAASKKKLYLVEKASHHNIELLGGDEYYNFISEFVINSVPKKQKDTRFKKLALNDHEGHH